MVCRRLIKRKPFFGDAHRQGQILLNYEPRTIGMQLNHLAIFNNRHCDTPAQISGTYCFAGFL